MRAWVYQAALLCEDCTCNTMNRLKKGKLLKDVDTGDSNDFPQGPYSDGGGEADCPQHCDACGVFLENPLTSDGEEYVRRVFRNDSGTNVRFAADCVPEWRDYYSHLLPNTEEQDNA